MSLRFPLPIVLEFQDLVWSSSLLRSRVETASSECFVKLLNCVFSVRLEQTCTISMRHKWIAWTKLGSENNESVQSVRSLGVFQLLCLDVDVLILTVYSKFF
ncbi:hypothetical protein TNCV_1303611 [Trichonephila clavipes]|nr:hypothetical protein TNCV_1303611 [Trichonephila clavipes]